MEMGASEETVQVFAKSGGGYLLHIVNWNGHGALVYAHRYAYSLTTKHCQER